ncbi:MAG TPA: hypothetical protein VLS85_05230 [Hanamia sp.]|nr:hypothetical protein [Hanamia sp.]
MVSPLKCPPYSVVRGTRNTSVFVIHETSYSLVRGTLNTFVFISGNVVHETRTMAAIIG